MEKETTMGTASLVLGILGIVLWLLPYIAIILSILAIIFSSKQKKIKPTGKSTAGFFLYFFSIYNLTFFELSQIR